MYLRDLTVYADDAIVERYKGGFVQRFHREACSVAEPYLAELYRKIVTDSIAKVGLTFTDVISVPPEVAPGQCFFPWPFDFAAYNAAATNNNKQQLLLESLHAALIWIAQRENWVTDSFETAHKAIVDRKFSYVGYSKKLWLCPAKRFQARIFFDWQLDGIDLFAVLFCNRSKTELTRKHLGTAVPMQGILREYLNAGKWQSTTSFEVAATHPFRKTWVADFADPIATKAT